MAKNVVGIFRLAREQNAVLLFDEADAIASRRSTALDQASQREINAVVNVLLQELESFNGVVIFATNMAANFDRAFERRIRTHVLFDMPGPDERAGIWRVQIHPTLTPLATDVDFRALAEKYEASGGDIRNAVLKAALAAATEPGSDATKQIHQRHFEAGIREVIAARAVMRQTIRHADREPAEPQEIAAALWQRITSARDHASWRSFALSVLALLLAIAALGVALIR
jgi:SpoVK/Ycf46/Vps4 family AAA+-type ATPase